MDRVSLPTRSKKPIEKNLLRYALAAVDLFGKLSNAGDTETVLSALRARFQTLCLKGEISKHGLSYNCIFSAFWRSIQIWNKLSESSRCINRLGCQHLRSKSCWPGTWKGRMAPFFPYFHLFPLFFLTGFSLDMDPKKLVEMEEIVTLSVFQMKYCWGKLGPCRWWWDASGLSPSFSWKKQT